MLRSGTTCRYGGGFVRPSRGRIGHVCVRYVCGVLHVADGTRASTLIGELELQVPRPGDTLLGLVAGQGHERYAIQVAGAGYHWTGDGLSHATRQSLAACLFSSAASARFHRRSIHAGQVPPSRGDTHVAGGVHERIVGDLSTVSYPKRWGVVRFQAKSTSDAQLPLGVCSARARRQAVVTTCRAPSPERVSAPSLDTPRYDSTT